MTKTSLLKKNGLFFFGSVLFLVASVVVMLFFSKADGFYLLNHFHNRFYTYVFIWFTYLGDGIFCIAVGIMLIAFRRRFLGLMVLASYALSGIIAQVLKYYIIEARPAVYLKDTSYPYFIDEVTLHNLHAFPSGHTASAFAMAAVLSFSAKNKRISLLFLTGAILVGYSRIYLAQHFLDDVLAGAIIGLVSALICWIYLEKFFTRLLNRRKGRDVKRSIQS
jgi:membrane-associated phospholipid phosphatase